jgi:hypothetical protein
VAFEPVVHRGAGRIPRGYRHTGGNGGVSRILQRAKGVSHGVSCNGARYRRSNESGASNHGWTHEVSTPLKEPTLGLLNVLDILSTGSALASNSFSLLSGIISLFGLLG